MGQELVLVLVLVLVRAQTLTHQQTCRQTQARQLVQVPVPVPVLALALVQALLWVQTLAHQQTCRQMPSHPPLVPVPMLVLAQALVLVLVHLVHELAAPVLASVPHCCLPALWLWHRRRAGMLWCHRLGRHEQRERPRQQPGGWSFRCRARLHSQQPVMHEPIPARGSAQTYLGVDGAGSRDGILHRRRRRRSHCTRTHCRHHQLGGMPCFRLEVEPTERHRGPPVRQGLAQALVPGLVQIQVFSQAQRTRGGLQHCLWTRQLVQARGLVLVLVWA